MQVPTRVRVGVDSAWLTLVRTLTPTLTLTLTLTRCTKLEEFVRATLKGGKLADN